MDCAFHFPHVPTHIQYKAQNTNTHANLNPVFGQVVDILNEEEE